MIDSYLAEFDRELSFDRKLARRVHQEVEAHLLDAIDDAASEGEAIRRFCEAQILSRSYAEAALPTRLRNLWIVAIMMAVTTFAFMRLRSILMTAPETHSFLLTIFIALDRVGFFAGIAFSLYAWWVSRHGIHRIMAPLFGAVAAFLLSVIASLGRAIALSGDDQLIWGTGALEILAILATIQQMRMMQRHNMLASS